MSALGILLVVVGSILAFAVDRQVEGVDLVALGWIVILGGLTCLVVAAVQGATWMTASRHSMRVERHRSPDGRHSVEETIVR